jgi:polypeptide N-acetylgalactosaminyltransferase
MDSLNNKAGGSIGIYGCHSQGGNQAWTLTRGKELRHDELCVEVRGKTIGMEVILKECSEDVDKPNQFWEYDNVTGHIRSTFSSLCLEAPDPGRNHPHKNEFLKMFKCEPQNQHQLWSFQNMAPDEANPK